MNPNFQVVVQAFRVVREIDDAWTETDYRALLTLLEFDGIDDVTPADVKEMCIMSLQDLKPAEAAEVLLSYRLSDALTKGQIENASHEMLEEKLWEEFADLALHERMFYVGSLLYQVSPRTFPKPDAVQVQLVISATNNPARERLAAEVAESWVVRLVADGMPNNSALHRMFDDQLSGEKFPEADKIIWTVTPTKRTADALTLDITSSGLWLDPLEDTEGFESSAQPDL